MKRLPRLSLNRKGLTLAELLVALAMVPGLLLASSTFSMHIAKTMQDTTNRGSVITQREQIVNMLQRYIANGKEVTVGTDSLTVILPDGTTQTYYFNGMDLMMNGTNLTFSGSKDGIKADGWLGKQSDATPMFEWSETSKSVKVKIKFSSYDRNIPDTPISFDVKLRGGSSVT